MAGSSMNAKPSWLSTAGERTVLGVAVGIGAFVFCAMGGADWVMYDAGISPFGIMLLGAALAGVLAFGFTFRFLSDLHERRATLARELKIIGDTNHHIRNALVLIQLSARDTHDQHVIQQISVAVDRIQWVLREIMGETSFSGEKVAGDGSEGDQEKKYG